MRYKHFSVLLLLQVFLFIQCSTAETADSKKHKSNGVRDAFVDTSKAKNLANAELIEKKTNGGVASEKSNRVMDKKNSGVESHERLTQANFKRVEFGFNIGYMADLQYADLYRKVLTQIKQDGITNLRIYEPFTKSLVQKPSLATELLTRVKESGFNILLCLSNYPDIPSIQYDQSNNPDQSAMRAYTNRQAPKNIDAYQSYLSNFLDNLQSKNLLQNVSFEIGNEPDAKTYFWGKPNDFIRVARAVKQTLAKYNEPVYCCGFTSEFANQGSSKNADYYNLLNDNSFFDHINLSFHFYKNDVNDITKIHLPRLDNSIISEFNMYSYQKKSTQDKTAFTNSPAFVPLLVKALVFAYKNNIKAIYLFKVADTPGKEGTTGFFDENGNVKPSYNYFKSVFDVVKDGYAIQENNNSITITGDNETILYASRNNVSIPNKSIVSSSTPSNGKTLDKDNWVIYKN